MNNALLISSLGYFTTYYVVTVKMQQNCWTLILSLEAKTVTVSMLMMLVTHIGESSK